MLQVAGCRGPGDSGAVCMLEWGKERGVLSSLSYHRAPSVTRHARSIAGTSELRPTRVNKPENDDPSIVEPVELATQKST